MKRRNAPKINQTIQECSARREGPGDFNAIARRLLKDDIAADGKAAKP
jgi:hypothetical protein